jgi:hypothetical protein
MNRLFLICTNDKKFATWVDEQRKRLRKNPIMLDHFNASVGEMRYGNHLAKATFVAYWEIQRGGGVLKMSPAITQATLIHLMHRFLEQGKEEEGQVVAQMISNFLRLLQAVEPDEEE